MPGKHFDDLQISQVIKHSNGRTVTEMDNVLFSALTMNTQPLHLNEDFASRTEFGQRIVNGLFTLALATGLTVADLTEGTIVANLGYETVRHPHPLFHGDTLYVETEVLDKREFTFAPQRGHRPLPPHWPQSTWHRGRGVRADGADAETGGVKRET